MLLLLHRSSEVQALVGKVTDRRIVTYGFNAQADIRATNVSYMDGSSYFDVTMEAKFKLERLSLPMPGNHNISNALAAITCYHHLDVDCKFIRRALSEFKGVNRRFTQ